MSEIIPQDTPITRASILQMDEAQLLAYVETLQTRRLASWNIYLAGKNAKERATNDKLEGMMQKALEKFIKQHEAAAKQIEKLDKCAIDIQALRLALGDLS